MRKKVALTFDDGPNQEFTLSILSVLEKYKVKGAFFVCGKNVERHPEVIKQIYSSGHTVGNHGYSHSLLESAFGLLSKEALKTQIILENIINLRTKYYRPPFGFIYPWTKRHLESLGFTVVKYDTVGRDWEKNINSEMIAQKVLKKVKDGSIILLHDGHKTESHLDRSETVKALPRIIESLQSLGYKICPLEEIIRKNL